MTGASELGLLAPLGSLPLPLLFKPRPYLSAWGPEQETLAPSQKELDQRPGILGLGSGMAVSP